MVLGVLTFVSAKWQALSHEIRWVVLVSLFFLATNISGFYLWRQPLSTAISVRKNQYRKRAFGTGLILLGNLLIVANIGLLAQMLHIAASAYQLYLAWGLTVVIMALSLRITTLAILALILLQIGYWTGLSEVNWQVYQSWGQIVIRHIPLILAVIFVPLAYLCRSRWIFRLSAIAIFTNLIFNLNTYFETLSLNKPFWVEVAAFALAPSLLWSYDDSLFSRFNSNLQRFQPTARSLTFVFFGINFYIFSFRWQWGSSYSYTPTASNLAPAWLPVIDVVIFTLLAIWQWWNLLRLRDNTKIEATDVFVSSLIVIGIVIIILHHFGVIVPAISIFTFNLLLLVLACCLIKKALEQGKRGAYWGGTILLTLQIITHMLEISRMLEYKSYSLFNLFVFILCGVVVIGGGIWFERRKGRFPN